MEILVALVGVVIVVGVLLVRARRAGDKPVEDAPPPGPEDIQALIENGRTIDAIKAYRQLHDVGLKEAKDAVEAMARGESPGARPSTSYSEADIEAEIRAGNLINAIKAYRAVHGVGLKEAKDAVEMMALNRSTGPSSPRPYSEPVIEAELRAGNFLNAVKLYREMTGVGLDEAHSEVEALRNRMERR